MCSEKKHRGRPGPLSLDQPVTSDPNHNRNSNYDVTMSRLNILQEKGRFLSNVIMLESHDFARNYECRELLRRYSCIRVRVIPVAVCKFGTNVKGNIVHYS